MRLLRLPFLVLSLALSGAVSRADPAPARGPTIVFAGETLSLAYVEVMPDGSVLNEYLRPDETPEKWRVLVALRHHPDAFVDEIVLRWRNYLGGLPTAGLVLKEYQGNTRTDQRFRLSIRDASDRFLELNAMRFVTSPDDHGVDYYQAAVRIYDLTSDMVMEDALQKQEAFQTELPKLALKPIRALPGAPPPPAALAPPAAATPAGAAPPPAGPEH